jgi:uncharacterized protein (TIGR02171 family)
MILLESPRLKPGRIVFHSVRIGLAIALLCGCERYGNEGASNPVVDTVPAVPGMHTLAGSHAPLQLGSTSANAKKSEEQPVMEVGFSYAFAMDSLEVTRGRWRQTMGVMSGLVPDTGMDDEWPVVGVTWFDAVLFCNARSKQLNLDTVYSYASIQRDAKGHAVQLHGFRVHFNKLGMRLPTEAEWVWCATLGGTATDPSHFSEADTIGWNAQNSSGTLHAAGRKKPNRWGFHDMYGNAMEWTFDWMGPFRQGSVRDFVGASEPNVWLEKVVKGGAFHMGWNQLRASARSATYPMAAGASTGYLGFRMALGPIPNPNYLGAGGVSRIPLGPLTRLQPQFPANVKASRARLAVVRMSGAQRYLQMAEFMNGAMRVFETRAHATVFAPSLSPDGNWIAFGDGFEGVKKKGKVSVIDARLAQAAFTLPVESAAIPRWRVDAATQDTFLVFSSGAMDNTEAEFDSGAVYQMKMRGGRSIGGAQRISSGAYHDGYSADGKWLVSGYRHLKIKEMETGISRTHFVAGQNGKPNEDTSQVCNVSLSPSDSAAEILFLDFGSHLKSDLVGRPYGIHEIAFLSSPAGNILKQFAPPKGFLSFEDLEWSTNPRFAIAVLQTDAEPFSTLGLLDRESGETTAILKGEGMTQPHLWLPPSPQGDSPAIMGEFYLDSMGRYAEPFVNVVQSYFAAKMEILVNRHSAADIVFVGSSETHHGIQPSLIRSGRALNLGVSAAGVETSLNVIRHYVLPHVKGLKAVVFEVFFGQLPVPSGDYGFACCIETSRGFQFDRHHGFWADGFPPPLREWARTSYGALDLEIDSVGYSGLPSLPWGADTLPLGDQYDYKATHPEVQANLARIRDLVREMADSGVAVLLLQMPESPRYAETEYVSKFGPSVEVSNLVKAQLRGFCDTIPQCGYLDGHQNARNDFVESDFHDWIHLSEAGAAKFTPRVDSALADLLGRQVR